MVGKQNHRHRQSPPPPPFHPSVKPVFLTHNNLYDGDSNCQHGDWRYNATNLYGKSQATWAANHKSCTPLSKEQSWLFCTVAGALEQTLISHLWVMTATCLTESYWKSFLGPNIDPQLSHYLSLLCLSQANILNNGNFTKVDWNCNHAITNNYANGLICQEHQMQI